MERVSGYVEARHFGVGDLYALCVGVAIELAANLQTGFGRCVGDQFDDDEEAGEGRRTPALGDVAKYAVLDLVPLCAAETYAERSDAQEPYGSCLKDDG